MKKFANLGDIVQKRKGRSMKIRIYKNEEIDLLIAESINQNINTINPGVSVPKIDVGELQPVPIFITTTSNKHISK